MVLVRLVIATLVALRLVELVTEDRITEDFRNAWIDRFGEDTKMGYFVTCRRCTSVWAGFVGWVLTGSSAGLVVAGGLAASAMVRVVDDATPVRMEL